MRQEWGEGLVFFVVHLLSPSFRPAGMHTEFFIWPSSHGACCWGGMGDNGQSHQRETKLGVWFFPLMLYKEEGEERSTSAVGIKLP